MQALAGLGVIAERNFALGASTPWKRIRCKRGRGTSAARRRRPGDENEARKMAIYLSRELGGHNQGDIGKAVGLQKTSSVSSAYLRMKSRVAQERRLVRIAQNIGEALAKSKKRDPFR